MNNPRSNTSHGMETAKALSAIGKALSTYSIYGLNHPIFEQTSQTAFQLFSSFLDDHKVLKIGTAGGRLVVDDLPVEEVNPLIKGLERKITALGITNLMLRRGLTLSEFMKLIELLHQANEDKLKQAINSPEINNISSDDAMEYRLVHKGHHDEESDSSSAFPSGTKTDAPPAGKEAESSTPDTSINVEQIVAFMKGDIGADNPEIEKEVSKLASDPEKLGQMILESVVMRQSVQSLSDTESMGDIVLGCLRKTFDSLKDIDVFQKRGGKASMKKALLMLESSILERIRKVTGKADPELDKKIVKAIKNMKMDIDVESALAKYVEQTAALQRSQEKICNYIDKRGIADIRDARNAEEILESEWRQITVGSTRKKHGIGPGTSGSGIEGLSGSMDSLAIILGELNTMIRRNDQHEGIGELLEQVEKDVAGITVRTEKKINELGDKIFADEAGKTTVEGSASRMTVAQLLGDIAEITQELIQPLTSIDAVLEMMLSGYVGDIPKEQRDLLTLAAGSGDHLGYLMEQLKQIVGMPRTLKTDPRFHHSLGLRGSSANGVST